MRITVYRDSGGIDSTIGRLTIGQGLSEYLHSYTCEDQRQNKKIAGETRIPAGVYEIKLRHGSPMSNRYDSRYSDIDHSGMLWLQEVPNFSYVYMHSGNNDDDTEGCILVGYTGNIDIANGGGNIGRSSLAYKDLYKKVHPVLMAGEKVYIEIKDEGVK